MDSSRSRLENSSVKIDESFPLGIRYFLIYDYFSYYWKTSILFDLFAFSWCQNRSEYYVGITTTQFFNWHAPDGTDVLSKASSFIQTLLLSEPAGTTVCTLRPQRHFHTNIWISVLGLNLLRKRINSRLSDIYMDRKLQFEATDWWNWLGPEKGGELLFESGSERSWGLSGAAWPGENVVTLLERLLRVVQAFKWSWRRIWREVRTRPAIDCKCFSPQRTKASPRFTERSQWSYLTCWTLLLTQWSSLHL